MHFISQSIVVFLLIPFFIPIVYSSDTIIELPAISVTSARTGETDLQLTPISITSFNSSQIDTLGLEDIKDLVHQTPGLSLGQNVSYGQIYIRGVGTNNIFPGSEGSNAVHLDGVYMARPLSVLTDFNDVERIEVLRGPQGTLYGRNSTGGTINIITRLPTEEFYAKALVDYGSYNQQKYSFSTSGQLIEETLMGGVSFFTNKRDGWLDNLHPEGDSNLNEQDRKGIMGKLRWYLSDDTEIIISGDVVDRNENGPNNKSLFKEIDGTPIYPFPKNINDPFKVNIPFYPEIDTKNQGGSVKIISDFNEHLILTSITAYREVDYDVAGDGDFTEANDFINFFTENQHQFTQEFQLNGKFDNLKWLAGFFYLNEQDRLYLNTKVLDLFYAQIDTKVETEAWALFLQGTYSLSDKLSLTLGGRYSDETKNIKSTSVTAGINDYYTVQEDSWSEFTPKLGIEYQFNDNIFTYATISKGFKSGGFNATKADDPSFDPEHLWAYEVGVKSRFLEQKLRVNTSLFYYDYQDIQVQQYSSVPPPHVVIDNIADASINGMEVELTYAPIESIKLDLGFSYLDSAYDKAFSRRTNPPYESVDITGNHLNSSPEYTVNLTGQYFQNIEHGTLAWRLNYYWQDDEYYTQFNDETTGQEAYGIVNASLAYTNNKGNIQVILYGDNLTNEDYFNATFDFGITTGVSGVINPPRTWGLRAIFAYE